MKISKIIVILLFVICNSHTFYAQDYSYMVSFDAEPLIKKINGREVMGEGQLRVVLTGREDQITGGAIAQGTLPTVFIDEEINIGKIIGVEVTLNGIGWTKSLKINTIKVIKSSDEEERVYDFPCGCQLTQGNQNVYIDAGGAVDFVTDAEAIKQEEKEEFELEGEFADAEVSSSKFTISKRVALNERKKVGQAQESKSGSMVCTTQNISASASFDINFLTNPTTQAIYPGALIYAEDISNGSYKNIPVRRAAIDLSTSSAVIGIPKITVEQPNLANIRTAMNDIMINQDRGDLEVQANFEITEVSSEEELSIALGAYFDNPTVSAKVDFSYDTRSQKSLKVVKFSQIYYTMDVNQPYDPFDVFHNPKDAIKVLNSNLTPLYVSQVVFGRIAYFFMETSMDGADLKNNIEIDYKSVGGNTDMSKSMEKNETKITALIIGGNQENQGITAVDGYEGFLDMLRDGGSLSTKSLGSPISYTLRFLSDNSIARTNLTTNYVKRTCKKFNDPKQNVRIELVKVTSDGELGYHGSCNVSIEKNNVVVGSYYKSLHSETNPGNLSNTMEDVFNGYKSNSNIIINVNETSNYTFKIDFTVTESDSNIFHDNDTNNQFMTMKLSDVLATDKMDYDSGKQDNKISVVVDGHKYTLHYKVYIEK